MRHVPAPAGRPIRPLLSLAGGQGSAHCQEEWCAWYSPLHGCAINALASLEDIASKE